MYEYIIINKTVFQKEMEELKQLTTRHIGYAEQEVYDKIDNLISQSTPLIPEIKKAFETGRKLTVDGFEEEDFKDYEDYISNLKLDV